MTPYSLADVDTFQRNVLASPSPRHNTRNHVPEPTGHHAILRHTACAKLNTGKYLTSDTISCFVQKQNILETTISAERLDLEARNIIGFDHEDGGNRFLRNADIYHIIRRNTGKVSTPVS